MAFVVSASGRPILPEYSISHDFFDISVFLTPKKNNISPEKGSFFKRKIQLPTRCHKGVTLLDPPMATNNSL